MNSAENKHIEIRDSQVARLILFGEWLYDGIVSKPVRIFALNYDFYFHLDEGYHDEGENPELNSQSEQYVVVWHNDPFFNASDLPSNGFMNVTEARRYAESVVQKVKWQEPVTDRYV